MTKRLIISFLAMLVVLSTSLIGVQAKASSNFNGKLVKMNGLTSLYYVASDGKRYVFPNENIYKSWFTDFDDVLTLNEGDLIDIPLGGNVLYRPGILLVKITTDPKVYAVTKGGILRWVKSEGIAKALYGDKWSMLVDDVPDSFFTNYSIGNAIDDTSEYDPDEEAENANSIDANRGLSTAYAKRARTKRCNIISNSRHCREDSGSDSNNNDNTVDDGNSPRITDISISDTGDAGRIDTLDQITITFSEAIDPSSINNALSAGGQYSSFDFDITGSITVTADGLVTIENIAAFDIGSVEDSGKFGVKMALSLSGKTLTITLLAGSDIRISDEDFEDATQIGGTISDTSGNTMEDDDDIGKPSGTFGGENVNDGIEPYITAINVYNGGQDDYIDVDDEIRITFSEEIDPESINNDLLKDNSVDNVEADETGGVKISSNGVLTIEDIASFYVGDVEDNGEFIVSLAMDQDGKKLTITLTGGDDIELSPEDLDDAKQIGNTVEDRDGNEMDDDPNIDDPTGSFVEDSSSSDDPYITYIKAYNYGYAGYIDEGDKIVITFSSEIDPETINDGLEAGDDIGGIDLDSTGGVYVKDNGLLTVTDILTFDVGDVENGGNFFVNLALSSSGKVLTITITDGDSIEMNSETFKNTTQLGGTLEDVNNNVMDTEIDIDNPSGTFGGDSLDTDPYIVSIEMENGNDSDYIDIHDTITVTFNEAIDPDSINNALELGSYVRDVDDDDTGGVIVTDDGILTISDIARFSVGDVDDDSEFEVKLSINDYGNVLTIDLTSGDPVEINYEDFDDAEQLGGQIEDEDGNEMEDDPRIDDPTGSF